MLRLVVLSCAIAVSCGNYAGNKDPLYPKVGGSVPKILNPGSPIDPRDVQNVGPVLKPGDVINPVVIDSSQVGPLGDQWVDNIPGPENTKLWVDTLPEGPIGEPWIDGQPIPLPGQIIDGRPIKITQNDGQIFNNPFINGQGSGINTIGQKPVYDNSVKPIVPVKTPPGYDGPIRNLPDNTPFVPGVGGDIFNPDFPGLDGGIIEPGYPVDPVRKVPDYGKSNKVPVPPVKKPAGYDGPIGIFPDNTPFIPGVNNKFPVDPVRKAPSYDNSHKLVRIPPLKKSASYDGLVKSVSKNKPFVPGMESGIFKPDFPGDSLRKAPSYDNSHKVPIPPVKKPAGYDGPVQTVRVPDNIPFVPAVGGGIFNPDFPVDPVRRPPSYDNSHKIPVPPVQKPGYDGPFKVVSDNTPFVPDLGGEIVSPFDPVRKVPNYDNSHKVGQIDPLRKAPSYDNSHKIVPDVSPFGPMDPVRKAPSYDNSHKIVPDVSPFGPIEPIRKAPSYDNSHKIVPDVSPFGPIDPPVRKTPDYGKSQGAVSGIGDILPPIMPPNYPGAPGSPVIGGPIPGDLIGSGTGIGGHSLEAQKQRFEEMLSERLGTRSGNSPAALPIRKELSAGKRNYLSSLGIFKKAKSYQS